MPQKPGFAGPHQRDNDVAVQADAVRAEPDGLQAVTRPEIRVGAGPGSGLSPFVDSSTDGISYGATSRQEASGLRSRGTRAAADATVRSRLVTNRITARNADRRTVRLEVGSRDVRIHRSLGLKHHEQRRGGGKRGRIVGFSAASARRLLFCARNFPGLSVMLTLTYPGDFPLDGRTVKNHWRRMRQWFSRRGNASGLWFLEFQARGAPHFHVFMPSEVPKNDVAAAWYEIVGSGDIRHLWAGTRTEALRNPQAAGAYAAKYASKTVQKDVPEGFLDVGRFWGTWGHARICEETVLPWREAVPLVRAVRRAYQGRRKAWKCAKRFRDNGVAGFTGWDSGAVAAEAIKRLTECQSGRILEIERLSRHLIQREIGAASQRPENPSGDGRRQRYLDPLAKRNILDSKRRSLGN